MNLSRHARKKLFRKRLIEMRYPWGQKVREMAARQKVNGINLLVNGATYSPFVILKR